MSTQSPLPQNDPMLIAFQKLKKTPEYQNAVKWTIKAENEGQADGELWFAFAAGYTAANQWHAITDDPASLPDKDGVYLWTCNFGGTPDVRKIQLLTMCDGSRRIGPGTNLPLENFLAWMSLPEPYQGGGE